MLQLQLLLFERKLMFLDVRLVGKTFLNGLEIGGSFGTGSRHHNLVLNKLLSGPDDQCETLFNHFPLPCGIATPKLRLPPPTPVPAGSPSLMASGILLVINSLSFGLNLLLFT